MVKNLNIKKPRIGIVYPGQRWVELNGSFTVDELRTLALEIEKKYKKVVSGSTK